MRFLFDANMPRSALQVLIQANYIATHVRDQGLGDASGQYRLDRPVLASRANHQSHNGR